MTFGLEKLQSVPLDFIRATWIEKNELILGKGGHAVIGSDNNVGSLVKIGFCQLAEHWINSMGEKRSLTLVDSRLNR